MNKDVTKRLTVQQALDHSWFKVIDDLEVSSDDDSSDDSFQSDVDID